MHGYIVSSTSFFEKSSKRFWGFNVSFPKSYDIAWCLCVLAFWSHEAEWMLTRIWRKTAESWLKLDNNEQNICQFAITSLENRSWFPTAGENTPTFVLTSWLWTYDSRRLWTSHARRSQVSSSSAVFLRSLTDSPAPGKSGTGAGWKALRAFSDAPRPAHVIPSERRANILQSARYLPGARVVHLRSGPRYQNIERMSNGPAAELSSEGRRPIIRRSRVQLLVTSWVKRERKEHTPSLTSKTGLYSLTPKSSVT